MTILSIDLARRSWSDIGVVLLESTESSISCEIVTWEGIHPPPVVELALRLNATCLERGANILMLDGPQAWRSEDTKSGKPSDMRAPVPPANLDSASATLPENYERFVGYCLALYDALGRLGWQRPVARDPRSHNRRRSVGEQRILLESYPNAAWKSLGIAPLPDRDKCRVSNLAENWHALVDVLPLTVNRPPNFSQLQAIVGGLPGFAIEEGKSRGIPNLLPQPDGHVRSWPASIHAPLGRSAPGPEPPQKIL